MAANEPPSREQLIDEAATWYARLDSGEAELADFEAWRAADSRRAVAFAQIVGTVNILDDIKRDKASSDTIHSLNAPKGKFIER